MAKHKPQPVSEAKCYERTEDAVFVLEPDGAVTLRTRAGAFYSITPPASQLWLKLRGLRPLGALLDELAPFVGRNPAVRRDARRVLARLIEAGLAREVRPEWPRG